jgi:hypothetical protein
LTRILTAIVVASGLTLAGCSDGARSPTLTEATGVVLLGGQPLPNAQVTFLPTAPGLGANVQATGVTDEKGHFTLTTGGKAGAAVGENLVTVAEGPIPEELRREEAQDKLARFRSTLKNRPIPEKYGSATSGIKVNVTKDQKEYRIELTR